MTSTGLPNLDDYRAVLFDLDGVLTPTADVHMHAWRAMFTELFAAKGVTAPYTDDDYFQYLDGKKRYDGVAGVLASRGIEVPWGTPTDPSSADTVCGIGNRKNDVFSRILEEEGVAPYPGSVRLLDQLQAKGVPMGVVSSSANAERVLVGAHLRDRFPVLVDGIVATREHLASKPAGDMFVYGARLLGSDPAHTIVFEDAIAGVAAGRAGGFALVIGVDRGVGEQALLDAGAHVVIEDLGVLAGGDR
ncbi:HAD family phosphatase [Naasia sp. SYSU D00057]|uniref:HAD family hydrolase n=1 Tax=Naasia sp. SYSU D00057 TaxID=2817380 RepID=UPI001B30A71D|nr:HAD-IA family hydrolase [Naasia sp. SYSU D00057]